MKKVLLPLFLVIISSLTVFSQTDKIIGHWKTIDDKDGSTKSIVYIFKATNGKYYGKIEKLYKNPDALCAECEGKNKDKPIVGLTIIQGMSEDEGSLTGGTILDPKTGKIYYCSISYDATSGNLQVRGSLDKKGWIGRSQTWVKANN
jgi:uncharacterized protein (DUF2147 family)